MQQPAEDLLRFIDRSPTPWHATASVEERLIAAGFRRLEEGDEWSLAEGDAGYAVRDGSSIIAFRVGAPPGGLRILGAHTDSPGFRVKPRGASAREALLSVAVEVYGAPIVATFADRELTLAGRVITRGREGRLDTTLVDLRRPLLRLPTPAIHLNRDVNEQGLRFDAEEELPLVLGAVADQLPADADFRRMIGEAAGADPDGILSWELAAVDVQPGSFYGVRDEFIASARLDNLASCHAAVEALLAAPPTQDTQVVALFDHEEVGSQSYKGADGTFLQDVLVRLALSLGHAAPEARQRMLSRSILLSADMAHAVHPNFLRYYDAQHAVRVNGGPVIKINAKQRYATDALGEAYFSALCEDAGVPCQKYVHRNNLPCGSTIGPIAAARLGIRTIDVGNPMWSMHSARESAGAYDHAMMIKVLNRFYADTRGLRAS
jgi:aspartyl aminopeptidase